MEKDFNPWKTIKDTWNKKKRFLCSKKIKKFGEDEIMKFWRLWSSLYGLSLTSSVLCSTHLVTEHHLPFPSLTLHVRQPPSVFSSIFIEHWFFYSIYHHLTSYTLIFIGSVSTLRILSSWKQQFFSVYFCVLTT